MIYDTIDNKKLTKFQAFFVGIGNKISRKMDHLHSTAAWPENIFVEHGYNGLERWPYGDKVLVRDGEIAVPMHPGLGLDPNKNS